MLKERRERRRGERQSRIVYIVEGNKVWAVATEATRLIIAPSITKID